MPGSRGRAGVSIIVCTAAAGLLGGITSHRPGSPPGLARAEERARVLEDYAQTPLVFERNGGQTDPRVRYLARGLGYTFYLTGQDAVFSLPAAPSEPGVNDLTLAPSGAAIRMGFAESGPALGVVGRNPLPGVVNYLKGTDPGEWHTGIPTFGQVRYREIYPGTDLVFRGTRAALEYDFRLAPGADPERIVMGFEGAEDLEIDEDGNLVITTPVGELVHRAPVIYQKVGGERREVIGAYRLSGDQVGFVVGSYDRAGPLVIDPVVLRYSTFLGGSDEDQGFGVAVDPYTRHAYVTGYAGSTDFPTTTGAFDQTHNGDFDVFVTKLGPTGAALSYSTFLGGSGLDEGRAIALDGAGAAYVTGHTTSTDFPTTVGAFDQTHNGIFDAFVTKLGPTGAVLPYSTFLGGSSLDQGRGIALDGAGAAYVTGSTGSTDFPTTAGAFDHDGSGGAFVTKLGPTGAALTYSTFLGGSGFEEGGFGIAVDGTGAAYVTGSTASTDFPTTTGAFDQTYNGGFDVFVTKLVPTGAALSYSTFLGGSSGDTGRGITVDGAGAAYLIGSTDDAVSAFPTTAAAFDQTHNGGFDVFVTKLGPTGAALGYSTFLGGSGGDFGHGIAVDSVRTAYVTGATQDAAADFPTTAGAFDQTHNGHDDVFVTKVGPTGAALGYSTYLGDSSFDAGFGIAVDNAGAYVAGTTRVGFDFPTTPGAFDQSHNGGFDAFATRLVEPNLPAPPPPGLLSSAPACRGVTATHAGTDGDDTITGTPARDVIAALGGNDLVKALGGDDVVCAGQGNDSVAAGEGPDRVRGENGRDKVKGGRANDMIDGGNSVDICIGGSGQDKDLHCERTKGIP